MTLMVFELLFNSLQHTTFYIRGIYQQCLFLHHLQANTTFTFNGNHVGILYRFRFETL